MDTTLVYSKMHLIRMWSDFDSSLHETPSVSHYSSRLLVLLRNAPAKHRRSTKAFIPVLSVNLASLSRLNLGRILKIGERNMHDIRHAKRVLSHRVNLRTCAHSRMGVASCASSALSSWMPEDVLDAYKRDLRRLMLKHSVMPYHRNAQISLKSMSDLKIISACGVT